MCSSSSAKTTRNSKFNWLTARLADGGHLRKGNLSKRTSAIPVYMYSFVAD